MQARASHPFLFSVLLHGAVLGVVVGLMLRVTHAPEETPVIFDLPPGGFQAQPEKTSSAPSAAIPTGVIFKPLPVPEIVTPSSATMEKAVAATQERVTTADPVKPTATTPREVPRPAARPETKPTTLVEHRRAHPLPGNQPATAAPPSGPVTKTPRIDVTRVLPGPGIGAPSATSGPSSNNPTSRERAAGEAGLSDSFLARLTAKLGAAHEKPAGLDGGLQAQVSFLLHADGRITAVRIATSSGHATFDASVLAAFNRLGDLGLPPATMVGVNQITFRTEAE